MKPILALALLATTPALAGITVPSGQPVELYAFEVVAQSDTQNLLFVGVLAPELAKGGYEAAQQDLDTLCRDVALPEVVEQGRLGVSVQEVSIRMADKPLVYGQTSHDVTQFMGFYEVISGECQWH